MSGPNFELRPVALEDAEFIFALRRDPRLAAYIHETPPFDAHYAWIVRYLQREFDYYFIVADMLSGAPQGTSAFYNFDVDAHCAEWGRWIIAPGSLAAVESAYLSYSVGFERLGLQRIICRTVADNSQTLAFHEACGLVVNSVERNAVSVGPHVYDIVEHMITREIWSEVKPALLRRCVKVSSILRRRAAGRTAAGEVIPDKT